MKGIHLVPEGTKIKFMSWRHVGMIFSTLLMILSVFLFFTKGLNYGIDFVGGTMIQVQTKKAKADIPALREKLKGLKLGDVQVQGFGKPNEVLIRIQTQPGGEKAQQKVVDQVKSVLGKDVTYRRTEVVGPTVSGELFTDGMIAIVTAILAVLVYIWLRFEWQFALGAVGALIHDVVLTIGIFSLLGLEFNLSIIAAILTIVGYSLNDTVVVFDRVRENLRKFKKMPLLELLDLSLNETLSRTLMTSLTTLLALLALYLFGPAVISGFTFAMIWGVIVGTYSSIVIASPTLNIFGVKRDWSGNKTAGTPVTAA